jgi:hypothetical protein
MNEAIGNSAAEAPASKTEQKERARRFFKTQVEMETVGGRPLVYELWVSSEKPAARKKHSPSGTSKEASAEARFKCDLCGKTFNENKKLLLHARYHKEGSDGGVFTCTVCSKSFDQQRKLLLHARYHKDLPQG